MEQYKDKFNNVLAIQPTLTEKDTLMSSFCLFLCGNDSKAERFSLRKKLLQYFKSCLESPQPFTHPCIKSFVHRLHAINQIIPKSAESFYLQSENHFISEGLSFIQRNSQESYISDKYTFCYLVSELFKVHVYLGETILSSNIFDDSLYSMYILEQHDRFYLLSPILKIHRIPYRSDHGIEKDPLTVAQSLFLCLSSFQGVCNLIGTFIPPCVIGFKVHSFVLKNVNTNHVHMITPVRGKLWRDVLKEGETLYVYSNLTCLSSVSFHGKSNPYFYIEPEYSVLHCVIMNNQEDADRAVRYETL